MAAFEKYTDKEISYKLRHLTREHPKAPKNIDIDPSRSNENYYLSPEDHGRNARECKSFYNHRLNEVYHMNRDDVKTGCQWVITAPKDLDREKYAAFFHSSYEFLNSLYGEKNCLLCCVHVDEGIKDSQGEIILGNPHMHYMFIPVTENRKYMQPNSSGNITEKALYPEKVCADQLINPAHMRTFHPDYQKWLDDKGFKCTVHSGVTGGINRTVEELKETTREIIREKERVRDLEKTNQELRERLETIERALEKEKSEHSRRDKVSAWGRSHEKEKDWEAEY